MYFLFQILICLKAGTHWRKFFISWWDLSTSGIFGGIFVSLAVFLQLILMKQTLKNPNNFSYKGIFRGTLIFHCMEHSLTLLLETMDCPYNLWLVTLHWINKSSNNPSRFLGGGGTALHRLCGYVLLYRERDFKQYSLGKDNIEIRVFGSWIGYHFPGVGWRL